jgi:EAL domain-containing protein (putative c-di-GMP-specific phosphodiesterase class I)
MVRGDAVTGQPKVESATAPSPLPAIGVAEAVDQRWLELRFQPKIDLKRKCLAGAEVLGCVRHPDRGLLMPGAFACEPCSEAGRLCEQVLISALAGWSRFEAAGFSLALALNVPALLLLDLPLHELLKEHRPSSDRWPGLTVEVTEDEIVHDHKLAQDVVAKLRGEGVKLALDHFGARHSSFTAMHDVPFAELKLHEGFVRDCAIDAANGAICQTVIDLAHRLGAAATAAGVESQADLQALMAMGCDLGQGALISPALSQAELLDLMREPVSKPRPPAPAATAVTTAGSVNKVA